MPNAAAMAAFCLWRKELFMARMSYIDTIERYHQYCGAIRELLSSILTGAATAKVFQDEARIDEAMRDICAHYPFVDVIYTLDNNGIQTSDNIACPAKRSHFKKTGKGKDRSQRPYFQLAKASDTVIVSEPYLSTASGDLCISAVLPWKDRDGRLVGYLVLDIDLTETVEYLMGDMTRKRFSPLFRAVYATIVAGLFAVVVMLLFAAGREMLSLLSPDASPESLHLKPFSVVVFLTLGLAIFDLGKTILEEEVLMHKDIYRHSSTRRTITRFIAAILIAVSIEGLLMMFKSVLGDYQHLMASVAVMAISAVLLIALGLYVYLGAKAERLLQGRPNPMQDGLNTLAK